MGTLKFPYRTNSDRRPRHFRRCHPQRTTIGLPNPLLLLLPYAATGDGFWFRGKWPPDTPQYPVRDSNSTWPRCCCLPPTWPARSIRTIARLVGRSNDPGPWPPRSSIPRRGPPVNVHSNASYPRSYSGRNGIYSGGSDDDDGGWWMNRRRRRRRSPGFPWWESWWYHPIAIWQREMVHWWHSCDDWWWRKMDSW